MVVIVCVEIFDAYRRTYKVPYDRAWTDFKSKEHCDSTISCSALLLISGRKIKMYYQKCRKNDHLDTNY